MMDARFKPVIAPAQAAQAKYKIPASITLAQWAVESGFGLHMPLGSNNPFGIKAAHGQPYVMSMTREVIHGISRMMEQPFAKFASLEEAFEAHGKIFYNGHYTEALKHLNDPDAFAHALTGVYATDPHYGYVLIGMMHHNNLYQFNQGHLEV